MTPRDSDPPTPESTGTLPYLVPQSITATRVARGTQAHGALLSQHISPDNPNLAGLMHGFGYSVADSTALCLLLSVSQPNRRSRTLAYIDTLRGLCTICLCMLPLMWWMKSQLAAAGTEAGVAEPLH